MKLSLAALMLVPMMALNQSPSPRHEFAPEHNQKRSVEQNFSGITEDHFNEILDKVEKIYAPIIKSKDANLIVERFWDDDTINAYAHQSGDDWFISMYGGLARHEEVTYDAFAMVACHELGHHIGGFPKNGWATNEGQSDYYATLKCARILWADEDSIAVVAKMEVDEVAAKACEKQHEKEMDQAICKRAAMAGKSLARLLAVLGGESMPEFDTPDKTKVETTIDWHPQAQCRMDTYFAGALCTASPDVEIDDVDHTIGVCQIDEIGGRPRCWFNVPLEPQKQPVRTPKGVKTDRRS